HRGCGAGLLTVLTRAGRLSGLAVVLQVRTRASRGPRTHTSSGGLIGTRLLRFPRNHPVGGGLRLLRTRVLWRPRFTALLRQLARNLHRGLLGRCATTEIVERRDPLPL